MRAARSSVIISSRSTRVGRRLALLDLDPACPGSAAAASRPTSRRWKAPASSLDSARMIQLPSSVPQSSSRVMTSWATSTRRRVRYPESAVRSAVSARPLRAPWVEMKYSRTVMPSRKLLRTGTSMIRPDGSAIRPRMAPSWPMLPLFPRAPDAVIIVTGPCRVQRLHHLVRHLAGGVLPDADDLLVALVIGDEAALELLVDGQDGRRPPCRGGPACPSGSRCRTGRSSSRRGSRTRTRRP